MNSGKKIATKDNFSFKQITLKKMTGTEVMVRNTERKILEKALGRVEATPTDGKKSLIFNYNREGRCSFSSS